MSPRTAIVCACICGAGALSVHDGTLGGFLWAVADVAAAIVFAAGAGWLHAREVSPAPR